MSNSVSAWDVDAPFQGKLSPSDNFSFVVSLKGLKQTQKQESSFFTNLKDPSFGQSFTFYAITEEMVTNLVVKIKFVATSNTLKLKKVISRCLMKLDTIENNKVTKFWLSLEEQTVMKVSIFHFIKVFSTKFEKFKRF